MEELILKIINFSEYIFWFIFVFTIIVFIHEYGHYYVARVNKVDVEKFSIGFGPPIYKYKDKNNTIWQLSVLPFGGYVKFAGEMYKPKENNNVPKNQINYFFNKSSIQKASIVLAGPIANFILGFLIFLVVFIFFGKNFTAPIIGSVTENSPAINKGIKVGDKVVSINNKKVSSFEEIQEILESNPLDEIIFEIDRNNRLIKKEINPEIRTVKTFIGSNRVINYVGIEPLFTPKIGSIQNPSPASRGKLLEGDIITKINNIKVIDIREVINIVQVNAGKKLNLEVKRKNKTIKLTVIPQANTENNDRGFIGVSFTKERKKMNFLSAVSYSINSFFEIIYKTLVAFSEIIFGKRDHCEVGGPILIAKVSNDIVNTDKVAFLSLIALISINLGLINLFPLPLLDGGHFITYMIELVSGKNISHKIFKHVQVIGVILIFSLMSFSILNDIYCRILN